MISVKLFYVLAGIFCLNLFAVPKVITSSGPVKGLVQNNTNVFLGIPYALPPVGDLRWRKPEPTPYSSKLISATKAGPGCTQPASINRDGTSSANIVGNEDCLYLNIWAPKSSTPLPVMVFIHGGGFTLGTGLANSATPGSFELYNGLNLSKLGNVIIVTFDYRLGALGFLTHPALGLEDNGRSGNYGIFDQIAALKWVKQNISAFGGRPDQVTVFGESAGGMSVCTLMATPLAKGLFRTAILESFDCPSRSTSEMETRGLAIADKVGCGTSKTDSSCLRGKTAEELAGITAPALPPSVSPFYYDLTYKPVIDGVLLKENAMKTLLAGRGNAVGIIAGHNSGEFPASSQPSFIQNWAPSDFLSMLKTQYGEQGGSKIFTAYNPSFYPSMGAAVADFKTDLQFSCPQRQLMRAVTAQGKSAYGYVYSQPPFSLIQKLSPSDPAKPFHGSELISVFQKVNEVYDNISEQIGVTIPPIYYSDKIVEKMVGLYWTAFSKLGNPNSRVTATWPKYDRISESYLDISSSPSVHTGYFQAKCDLFDAYVSPVIISAPQNAVDYITSIYQDVVLRPASVGEINFWKPVFLTQGSSAVATGIINLAERKSLLVNYFFQLYLGRSPSTSDIKYWTGFFGQTNDLLTVHKNIAGSPESMGLNGCSGVISKLYANILAIPLDSSTFSHWMGICQAQGFSQAVTGILSSQDAFAGQVRGWYNLFLHRAADFGGLAFFTQQLQSGTPVAQILSQFFGGEYVAGLNYWWVQSAYQKLLKRNPSSTEVTSWTDQFAQGLRRVQLIIAFCSSAEYKMRYASDTAFVQSLYQNLLHRSADSAGLKYHVNRLANGASRPDVVADFVYGSEYQAF